MEGLNQTLQYSLVVCDCPTFPDLVNKALMLEDKRRALDDTRKRKMISKGSSSNQKPRPWQPAPVKPTYQQPRAPAPCTNYPPQQFSNPGQLTTTPITMPTRAATPIKSLASDVVRQDTTPSIAPTRSPVPRAPMRRTQGKAVECHQGTKLLATRLTMARVV